MMTTNGKKAPRSPQAPPVYRPQPVPKVLQKKSALLVKPSVYKPGGVPKVLQMKRAIPPARIAPSVQLSRSRTPSAVRTPTRLGLRTSNTIQRMSVRAWRDFDLDTFRYKGRGFRKVVQSEGRKLDVYIGKGPAYTTGMRTCASLAMYDPISKNSYLLHADATVRTADILSSVLAFQQQIDRTDLVYARIFTQSDEANSSTVQAIKAAFRSDRVTLHAPLVETAKRDGSYEIDWHSVVIVGHGKPYIYTGASNRLDYALKRYVRYTKDPEQVQYARDAIIEIIRSGAEQIHDLEEADSFLAAATKAYKTRDPELLGVLSRARAVDYEKRLREAAELKKPSPKPTPTATPTTATTTTTTTPNVPSRAWADEEEEMDFSKPLVWKDGTG